MIWDFLEVFGGPLVCGGILFVIALAMFIL
jgi:hypothetical protein